MKILKKKKSQKKKKANKKFNIPHTNIYKHGKGGIRTQALLKGKY